MQYRPTPRGLRSDDGFGLCGADGARQRRGRLDPNPASCCGLVGLKPSRGRTSLAPHFGDLFLGLVSELGATRRLRDTAALLDAVVGMAMGELESRNPHGMIGAPTTVQSGWREVEHRMTRRP